MPSGPTGIWNNNPNKKDHYTQGYSSKVIFNYQLVANTLEVANGDGIIATITSNGTNFKGSTRLNNPYFQNADGRCFRISMYYLKPYDGNNVEIRQQLYDNDNDITYNFDFNNSGGFNNDTGEALIKYECYLSVFYDTANSQYVAQANGSLIYAPKPGSPISMLQMSTYNILTNGYNTTYQIRILNSNGGPIFPTSLMIEEIS